MLRLAAGAAALVAVAVLAVFLVRAPYAAFREPVFVEIPKGAGSRRIAGLLSRAGVVRGAGSFLLVRALRPGAKLKAGEYEFKTAASAWDVFERVARGDIFYYSVVVPEGSNVFDIAANVERQKIMPAAEFLAAAHDPALVRDLDRTAPSLEGYLFPDTYRVARHTAPRQLCQMMTDRFRAAWRELGAPAARAHDTVTLASLVEKEARLPAERPLIASVFTNRLRSGMALQCDPTTIYAALLEDRYRGTIYRSDLESQQAYNTYQHAGLPPGPIANPGVDSLKAALAPAAAGALYFVAVPDGSGAHHFSKGLAEHTLAVQKYRRGIRKAEQASHARNLAGRKQPVADR
jgi:UPF0755 protein